MLQFEFEAVLDSWSPVDNSGESEYPYDTSFELRCELKSEKVREYSTAHFGCPINAALCFRSHHKHILFYAT